jgi:hypothetical protein
MRSSWLSLLVVLGGLIYAPGGGTERGGSSGSIWHQIFEVAGTCP